VLRRIRYLRLAVTTGAAVLLIPWILYLADTLPDRYVVNHWALTWVGFDVLLFCMFAATAVLGWLRRQLVVLIGFASGVLLLCDAWFDIMTANPNDVWVSVLAAALEVPIAILLIGGALRLTRYLAARLWLLEPGMHLWQMPLAVPTRRERVRA
jgi:hypothetical protein